MIQVQCIDLMWLVVWCLCSVAVVGAMMVAWVAVALVAVGLGPCHGGGFGWCHDGDLVVA